MTRNVNGEKRASGLRISFKTRLRLIQPGAACPESRAYYAGFVDQDGIEPRDDTTARRHGLDREDHKQGIAVSLSRQHFEY